MSQQQATKDILQPLPPQPLVPTTNKLGQLNPRDELQIYKRQYTRLVRQNNMLLAHLAKVTQEKETLEAKYNNLQVDQSHSEKRKRVRRTAGEILRDFTCCLEKCGKSYGTQASLCQHIKLKHPQIYGSKDYEQHIADLRKKTGSKITTNCEAPAESNAPSDT